MYDLDAIIQYEMNPLEAKAFKIALLWQDLAGKEFPGYQHVRLRKTGDPRKSILFKYCYKLVRETQGIIPDHEYRLYILAQLHILKNFTKESYARIDPAILVGDRAWKRWKRWKYLYDRKVREEQTPLNEEGGRPNIFMENELKRTKQFFEKTYGRLPTYAQIDQAMHDHTMIRWVTMARVSPYYILLSPYVKKSLGGSTLNEVFLFDLGVYEGSITPEIKAVFQKMFSE